MSKAIVINMAKAMENAEQGKKLSVKSVAGDVKKYVAGIVGKIAAEMLKDNKDADVSEAGDGDVHPVVRLIGLAHGYQNGEGDNGPWTALKGDFLGINLMGQTTKQLEDPKAKRSGKCFIPAGGEDTIISAIIQSDGGAVQVGVDIFIRLDSSSLLGYEYFLKPTTAPTANDPLMALASECKPLELPQLS